MSSLREPEMGLRHLEMDAEEVWALIKGPTVSNFHWEGLYPPIYLTHCLLSLVKSVCLMQEL